jgi:hypothetical protein
VAPLLDTVGWKMFLSATSSVRDLKIRAMIGKVDSHPEMCRHAGAVKALDDVLSWTDKVRTNAELARRFFDDNSDSSPQGE